MMVHPSDKKTLAIRCTTVHVLLFVSTAAGNYSRNDVCVVTSRTILVVLMTDYGSRISQTLATLQHSGARTIDTTLITRCPVHTSVHVL